jgi:uncharacterized surface protein with fasciclin (FAS1) repeats
MTRQLAGALFALALLAPSFAAAQTDPVTVGGAAMYPNKNIVENAANSADHTTLVAAVQAADLVETLQSDGPFTVFAPTNAAFEALPAGTVETLLQPENKGQLQGVLTYHVVPGRYDAAAITEMVKANDGRAVLTTAAGGTLTFVMEGDALVVMDAQRNTANIMISDVYQSNGVIHVVDRVLLPQM